MAQQLQNITVQAPGFAGINSQDSPLSLDQSFAATASNCIIDQYGRIGSRKGYTAVSSNNSALGTSDGVESLFESLDASGDKVVFATGNNKVFKLDASSNNALTDITPAAPYAVTANNWKIISFNNHTYFYQKEHEPLIYTDSGGSGVLAKHSDFSGATTPPQANEVIGAYGRLWAADVSGDTKTVYWTDTLQGHKWSGGTAGSLNLTTVFPTGHDEVVALAAHNGFLVIFCKRSIIVYSGAESPATMQLSDTIEGVGCIARDSVQHTGTDILFLSEDGVRSLGRTIQEKSMPMRDISNNVRGELMDTVRQQTKQIKSLYNSDEGLYLLALPDSQTVYCFDMTKALPDGANRVTTWSGIDPLCFTLLQEGGFYIGRQNGVFKYEGYLDDGESYTMLYYSNPLNFGNATNLKFLKKFNITVIGNVSAQTTLAWGYDYTNQFNKRIFSTEQANTSVAEFNIAKFGRKEDLTVAEPNYIESLYTIGTDIQRPKINTNGSGSVVTIGIESTINGAPYSIQQIDVHALLGRLI